MNLYFISQVENCGYDTYDSAVVRAESPEEAVKINPDGAWSDGWGAWASKPENVKVSLLGVAAEGSEAGEVLASFNAG